MTRGRSGGWGQDDWGRGDWGRSDWGRDGFGPKCVGAEMVWGRSVCKSCFSDTIISCKDFFLMLAILTKTVFCLQVLLLERPPFSYMNGDTMFLFLFFADHMHIHNIS